MFVEFEKDRAERIVSSFMPVNSVSRSGNFFIFSHVRWIGSDQIRSESKIHVDMLVKIEKLMKFYEDNS